MMPDNALQPGYSSGIEVSGIARNAQARVDIRQGGQLIFSTLVPAGPFTLSDVPIANLNTDLSVTVTETDGSESHFTVAASTFRSNHVGRAPGFSSPSGVRRIWRRALRSRGLSPRQTAGPSTAG